MDTTWAANPTNSIQSSEPVLHAAISSEEAWRRVWIVLMFMFRTYGMIWGVGIPTSSENRALQNRKRGSWGMGGNGVEGERGEGIGEKGKEGSLGVRIK